MARFIARDVEEATRVARHLKKAGQAECRRALVDEPDWVWLTGRGARHSGLGFSGGMPTAGAMVRMRAVNEVRLYLVGRAPAARWICSRSIVREQGARGYRPNAVLETDGERHAILVRYGVPHQQEREVRIIETHMARYDAVVCFANPRARAQLERLRSERLWPKLVIRPIPGPA